MSDGIVVNSIDVKEVGERIDVDHILGQVMCPFEHLGTDVGKERCAFPTPQYHDFIWMMLVEEESHRCSGPDGLVSDFMGMETENIESAKECTSGTK